jgi:hypothetical protein
MKYKQLTKEQIEALHKEFTQFLATQQIDVKEWEFIKNNNLPLVDKELDLFSDLVWEDVLSKAKYLEHFSKKTINLFKCGKTDISRIVVKVEKSNFDFFKDEDYEWFINHTNDDSITFLKGNKNYQKERNLELFELIKNGSVLSNGSLYQNIYKLINRK